MKKIFSILLASVAMSSCVDTVILPDNKILDEDYWQKKNEVDAVVAAAYSQLRDQVFMRSIVVWGDFRSDELNLSATLPPSATYKDDLEAIYSLNILPSNTFTSWAPLYSAINYCNLVLEKAEGVVAVDPDYTYGDYETNRSQVLALRALCYFTLVKVFRDVPVTPGAYMESSADQNAEQKAPAEVLQMCIDDLLAAEPNAPSNNAFSSAESSIDWRNRGLFNKDGINALLADIYLWRASVNHDVNDYQKCVEACDKVIAAKKNAHVLRPMEQEQDYYLASVATYYTSVFGSANSEESIFELQFSSSQTTSNAGLCQMYRAYRLNSQNNGYFMTTSNYAVPNSSRTSPNIFKNNVDQRLYESSYNAGGQFDEYRVRKFVAEESTPLGQADGGINSRIGDFYQNWIFYRLTDVMLMKAEALVQLDRLEDAFNLVKAVNDRALPTDVADNMRLNFNTYRDDMEKLVLQERARELCFEGKRWFDLMRYNYRHMEGVDYTRKLADMTSYPQNYNDFLELALSKYSSTAAMKAKMPTEPYLYMPINEDEVDLNTNLRQNPVYFSTSTY